MKIAIGIALALIGSVLWAGLCQTLQWGTPIPFIGGMVIGGSVTLWAIR